MSLAVADLLVGIFVMPPAVAVHLIGEFCPSVVRPLRILGEDLEGIEVW